MRTRKRKPAADEPELVYDPDHLKDPHAPPFREKVARIVEEAIEGDATKEARRAVVKIKRGFVVVPTWPLVQLSLEQVGEVSEKELARTVAGALVKVTAELRPSERETFDGGAIRARLLALGARAVILAPKLVPEAPKKADPIAKAQTAEQAVDAWFDALPTSVPEADREAAREMARAIVGKSS